MRQLQVNIFQEEAINIFNSWNFNPARAVILLFMVKPLVTSFTLQSGAATRGKMGETINLCPGTIPMFL